MDIRKEVKINGEVYFYDYEEFATCSSYDSDYMLIIKKGNNVIYKEEYSYINGIEKGNITIKEGYKEVVNKIIDVV